MKRQDLTKMLQSGAMSADEVCPIVYALSIIGQKWKIPILWHLSEEGTQRYNALRRSIYGITNIMLTTSLQELESHGLVRREEFAGKVPHTEYSLTDRGRSLVPLLHEIDRWGREQMAHDIGTAAALRSSSSEVV